MHRTELRGQICGHFYEPPNDHFDDCNYRELINLKEVAYLRVCLVTGEYGRTDKRGLLFQMKGGQEFQVNFCNQSQAEMEFNGLKLIMSKL